MEEHRANVYVEAIRSLPASLAFILLVDIVFIKDLVDLYKFQFLHDDPSGMITFISILTVVLVNIIIICFFASTRYLHEKRSILINSLKQNQSEIKP